MSHARRLTTAAGCTPRRTLAEPLPRTTLAPKIARTFALVIELPTERYEQKLLKLVFACFSTTAAARRRFPVRLLWPVFCVL